MAKYYGFNPPFWGGINGVLSRQEDEQLIKNDLRQLILTRPGERVHDPEFGTILRGSLFEPFTNDLAYRIEADIRRKIIKYDERVTVNSVDVGYSQDTQQLDVQVNVSPKFNNLVNYLVAVKLQTGGA